jgi:hypothetical protein
MAELDELYSQIPTDQIASKLGVDAGEVDNAIKTLVPVLVGGLQHNAQDADAASKIESAADKHAASGLLDGGVTVDDVDEKEGNNEISRIFGGNDTNQVASALAGGGIANSDLLKKLLPIITPIVLAYIGKKLSERNAPATTPAPAPQQQQEQSSGGGGLGDVLGSILGGGSSGGGNNPLGSILGSVLGGNKGNAIGEILGGLLGGKK